MIWFIPLLLLLGVPIAGMFILGYVVEQWIPIIFALGLIYYLFFKDKRDD